MPFRKILRHQLFFAVGILFVLCILVLFVRLVNPRELDDVHPSIPCEKSLLESSDVLWVIPIYDNESIAVNREWCSAITRLNKTLGMHGVYHTYQEFATPRDDEYILRGMRVFEQCFGRAPSYFKAPQLALSDENEVLLRRLGLHVRKIFHQQTRKVFHCSDAGMFPNWLIKII